MLVYTSGIFGLCFVVHLDLFLMWLWTSRYSDGFGLYIVGILFCFFQFFFFRRWWKCIKKIHLISVMISCYSIDVTMWVLDLPTLPESSLVGSGLRHSGGKLAILCNQSSELHFFQWRSLFISARMGLPSFELHLLRFPRTIILMAYP